MNMSWAVCDFLRSRFSDRKLNTWDARLDGVRITRCTVSSTTEGADSFFSGVSQMVRTSSSSYTTLSSTSREEMAGRPADSVVDWVVSASLQLSPAIEGNVGVLMGGDDMVDNDVQLLLDSLLERKSQTTPN